MIVSASPPALAENPSTSQIPSFPMSAVVGQDEVKLALLLNAVDSRIGGVLLRGEKGSAKSTLARSLAALLPGGGPFVELPLGASEDRVIGTLDIEAALVGGHRRLLPGLLAQAHAGVLYVDEINLLPDHLVDVLLDVAASGINRIEREGISESHPSRFILVGSMNPEEGDLRPQLLDRFGLAVNVATTRDLKERVLAVRRRLEFDADPLGFIAHWKEEEKVLASRLATSKPVSIPDDLLQVASETCIYLGAEGLRADIVICRAAAALAGFEGRGEMTLEDIRRVAPLVLGHRCRRSPFEEPGIDSSEIDEALTSATSSQDLESFELSGGQDDSTSGNDPSGNDPSIDDSSEQWSAPDSSKPFYHSFDHLVGPRSKMESASSGRRSRVQTKRGRLLYDTVPSGRVESLAVGATVRHAVVRRAVEQDDQDAPLLQRSDLREAVREQKTANLIVLAVDASRSMSVNQRIASVKGAVLALLLNAYQRRDRVSLVTFHGEVAEVVLRPTSSVEVAKARMNELKTGGRTPLSAGIQLALEVALGSEEMYRPLLVVVSDGRATYAPDGKDPLEEVRNVAYEVKTRAIPAVVVDVEDGQIRLGLAQTLADAMGARYINLPELSTTALVSAVRKEIDT